MEIRRYKLRRTSFYLVFILCLANISCREFRLAPLGIHGIYSHINDSIVYKTINLSKDSMLAVLKSNNLIVKNGRLHSYDPTWDSLSYLIKKIPCDSEHVEAYIEFQDKKSNNTTFRILWFNSTPTKNDSLYLRKTEAYYKCFEMLLKEKNIIR